MAAKFGVFMMNGQRSAAHIHPVHKLPLWLHTFILLLHIQIKFGEMLYGNMSSLLTEQRTENQLNMASRPKHSSCLAQSVQNQDT